MFSYISGKEAKKFIHGIKLENEKIDLQNASYCFDIESTVIPYELELVPQEQNIIGYIPKANEMTSKNFKYNLLAFWSFDDCSGTDFSNNNRNLYNTYKCVDGKKGKAAHLLRGSFLRQPFIDFNKYNEFTISMWVKVNSIKNKKGEAFIFFGDKSSSGWVGIGNFYNKIQFNVGKQSSKKGAGFLYQNAKKLHHKFHHYVMTYQNGLFKVYIDGKYLGRSQQRVKTPILKKRTGIGSHYWNNGQTSSSPNYGVKEKDLPKFLNAVFDEIIILNKKVNKKEINMLYKGKY